jgi:hypothetical protein
MPDKERKEENVPENIKSEEGQEMKGQGQQKPQEGGVRSEGAGKEGRRARGRPPKKPRMEE